MVSTPFVRFAALALMIAGVLWAVSDVAHVGYDDGQSRAANALTTASQIHGIGHFAGAALLALGMPALYIYNQRRIGGLGLASFIVAQLFVLMLVGAFFMVAFVEPAIAEVAPAVLEAEPPASLGIPLFVSFVGGAMALAQWGIVLGLRGRTHRGPAIALAVGAVAVMLPFDVPMGQEMILALAVSWLGLDMLRHAKDVSLDVPPEAAVIA